MQGMRGDGSREGGQAGRRAASARSRATTLARLCPLLALAAALTACATTPAPAPPDAPVRVGWTQVGEASWYGPDFHGRPTASGEIYDMEAMTAAHPHLPLGSHVRVTVLETGRNAELRINDRGPFVGDRILDASRAAARYLGFLEAGVTRVRVEVVSLPTRCHEVQVGSYASAEGARSEKRRLERSGEPVRLEAGPGGFSRVIAGPYRQESEARRVRERFGGMIRDCTSP